MLTLLTAADTALKQLYTGYSAMMGTADQVVTYSMNSKQQIEEYSAKRGLSPISFISRKIAK